MSSQSGSDHVALPAGDMSGRVPWIDWLRFSAAFLVLFGHARAAVFVEYNLLEEQYKTMFVLLFMFAARAGLEAVIVFFVISGFLVGGIAIERAVCGTFNWRSYAVDRAARIGTPLVPAVLLTLVISIIVSGRADWLGSIGNIVGLQGIAVEPLWPNAPLWSLSYEIWFYVLAGAVALVITGKRLFPMAAAAVALAAFLRLDPLYLSVWLVGAAAFFYRPWLPRLELFMASVVALAGAVLSQMTRDSRSFATLPLDHTMSVLILGVALAWLLPCLRSLRCPSTLANVGALAAAPSYSLYLCHYPVLVLCGHYGVTRGQPTPSGWMTFGALIGASLVGSLVMYLLFERNTRAVKAWLRRCLYVAPQKGDADSPELSGVSLPNLVDGHSPIGDSHAESPKYYR